MLAELRACSRAGGEILFGIDAGYIDHYNTVLEFTLMSQARMNFEQILASVLRCNNPCWEDSDRACL